MNLVKYIKMKHLWFRQESWKQSLPGAILVLHLPFPENQGWFRPAHISKQSRLLPSSVLTFEEIPDKLIPDSEGRAGTPSTLLRLPCSNASESFFIVDDFGGAETPLTAGFESCTISSDAESVGAASRPFSVAPCTRPGSAFLYLIFQESSFPAKASVFTGGLSEAGTGLSFIFTNQLHKTVFFVSA